MAIWPRNLYGHEMASNGWPHGHRRNKTRHKKMKYFNQIVYFYNLFLTDIYSLSFNCHLPEKCRIERVSLPNFINFNENLVNRASAIICDIKDDSFEFKVNPSKPIDKCEYLDNDEKSSEGLDELIFKWTRQSTILTNRFNFSNMYSYLDRFSRVFKVYY